MNNQKRDIKKLKNQKIATNWMEIQKIELLIQ